MVDNECVCQNGTPIGTPHCFVHGGNNCKKCNNGFVRFKMDEASHCFEEGWRCPTGYIQDWWAHGLIKGCVKNDENISWLYGDGFGKN